MGKYIDLILFTWCHFLISLSSIIYSVSLEQTPRNWVCEACLSSGRARGGKQVKKMMSYYLILPNIEMCLISKLVSPPRVGEKKNSTPGPGFWSWCPLGLCSPPVDSHTTILDATSPFPSEVHIIDNRELTCIRYRCSWWSKHNREQGEQSRNPFPMLPGV